MKKIICLLLSLMCVLPMFAACHKEKVQEESQEKQTTQETDEDMEETDMNKQLSDNTVLYFNDCGTLAGKASGNTNGIVTRHKNKTYVQKVLDAGVDVFVSETYGMVPLYPSEAYPVREHMDWYYNEYGGTHTFPLLQYASLGNDYMQDCLDATHEAGKKYFISYRVNDLHGLTATPQSSTCWWMSKFYVNHPEYRIGEQVRNSPSSAYYLDFSNAEVREYKLALIAELIENYDIDGFVLDFLRSPAFFALSKTTEKQRIEIMNGFVGEVKRMLDEKSEKTGKEYYLAAVLPSYEDCHGDLGLNVGELYNIGVNMFFFWDFYYSRLDFDLIEETKYLYGDALCFPMFSQATSYNDINWTNSGADRRYMTDEQWYTAAYNAYAHKADGLGLFNFWGYTDSGADYEIPWYIIEKLKDREFLATAPQHYFIGKTQDYMQYDFELRNIVLSSTTSSFTFTFDMKAPEDAWNEDGVLKLEFAKDVSAADFSVEINGSKLDSRVYIGEAYKTDYTMLVGEANQMKCFTVPKEYLTEGVNSFKVTLLSGVSSVKVNFIDLAIK